jgi:hypothetical protein
VLTLARSIGSFSEDGHRPVWGFIWVSSWWGLDTAENRSTEPQELPLRQKHVTERRTGFLPSNTGLSSPFRVEYRGSVVRIEVDHLAAKRARPPMGLNRGQGLSGGRLQFPASSGLRRALGRLALCSRVQMSVALATRLDRLC